PHPTREECGWSRRRQFRDHPVQRARARHRPGAKGEGRHERPRRPDHDAGAQTRAGRNARALAPDGHAVAGAALDRRRQHGRGRRGRGHAVAPRPKRQRDSLWRRQPDDGAEVTMGTLEMKCRGYRPTLRRLMARALSLSAVAALMFNQAALMPAFAGDYRIGASPSSADGQSNARFLSLGIGKSVVIDLPRDVKDVLVADPKIANAVVRSAQRA